MTEDSIEFHCFNVTRVVERERRR